jgi:L-ascorbate metabolism protein UlaG (beta-lactamase superfamily)
MKIKHYLYNSFIIESDKTKIAIDPGQNLWIFKLTSLIPKSEWSSITHLVVTHGDPDHYWQADRVAHTSNAPVVCGKELARTENGKTLLVDPRGKELTSWMQFEKVHALNAGESVTIDGVKIDAVRSVHGPIVIPILWFKVRRQPGPNERTGLGSMGFRIAIEDKTIVNLGDSLLQKEWEGLKPDILMLPIGGLGNNTWTMDATDGLEAVRLISPKLVIPCHYDVPFLFKKRFCRADDEMFKREVETMGIECSIMKYGDEIMA